MNTTPIEFMSWDKKENKFNTFYPLAIKNESTFTKSILWCEPAYGRWENAPEDRFVIMQLTSLRSTSDEPIYNHQIVEDQYGDMYEINIFDYKLMYALSADRELEIVGNRFQHPELLELCK